MKHLLPLPAASLVLLASCAGLDRPQPQSYPQQQGQWAPPGQWQQPGQMQPPLQQPVQPGPGQWLPPPQSPGPGPGPLAWWPQGMPTPGSLPLPVPVPTIPGVPAIPGLPGGAAQQCTDGINQYRARNGLPPLTRWFASEACAASEAQSDAQSGQPHGSFGRCAEGGQNVCPGWQGPAEQMTGPCLQSMYNEGPGADFAAHGHYLNMMSPRFTRVACGYFTGQRGEVWAVQDFQ